MTIEEKDITFGAVTDVMSNGNYYVNSGYSSKVKNSVDHKDTTITVKSGDLKFLDKEPDDRDFLYEEAAWVGFKVASVPTNDGLTSDTNAEYVATFTRNGENRGTFFEGKKSEFTGSAQDIVAPITVEDLQEAMKGDGVLTYSFVITWKVKGTISDTEATGEFKQNVTIKVEADKISLTDAREDSADKSAYAKTLWAPEIAKAYKASLPETPATPTEENKTTEENKKDDVPKTGEVIYWCC